MTDLLSLRVRLSVANPPVRRLIVCAGCCDDDQSGKTRGALGRLVARRLLETCSPSPSDIHNPDQNRMHARDAKGKARRGGGYRGRDQLWKHSSSYGGTRLREFGRNAQTWDSERVPDYMGLWCDRLLLGEHTTLQRCALLEPRVPLLMIGESLERVLLAHQHLKANDVLFVFGSCCSPFGVVKLVPFDDDLLSITHGGTPCWYQSIGSVLRRLQGERATASALVLGLGDKHGLHSPFEPEERSLVQSRIVPLLGFTCALWTLSPVKALEYLQSNPANNPRLWSTMQSSMLSTRDAAVLRALETGKTLDARLSQQHTIYLGETLLSRLFPPSQWLPYSDTPPEAFAVALHFQCQRGGWGPTTLAALEGRDGVVAGIVLGLPFFHADGSPFSRFVCVSLGCGTRCVGYSPSELIREADLTLRDGHAEVLARRGFVAFLLDAAGYLSESQERQHPFVSRCRYAPQTAGRDKCFDPGWECYRLQQGVTVHLICTQYLCGAMSVPFSGAHPILATPSGRCLFPCSLSDEGLRGIQEQSPLCEVISTDTASFLDNSVACFGHKIAVHRGHVANELPLIGRVKPGKGFQNLCMSCSDKLLRWQCLGIQGRRRTRLFPERIHLSSVWVPNTTPLVSSSCTTQCKESSLERARESLNGRKHYLLPRLFTAGTQAGTVGSEDSAGCCGDPPVVDVCGFELADLQPLLAWMKSSQTEDERNIMEDGKNDSCWSRSAWVKVGIGNSGVALCPRNRKRQKGEDECIDDGDHCSLCWCEKSILILNTKAGIPRGVTQQYMHRTVQRLLRFQQGTVSEEGSTGASLAGFLESVAARFPLSRLWMAVRQCAITHGGLRSFSRVSEESQSALKLKFGDIFNGDCSAGSFFFPVRLVSVDGLGEQRTIVAGGSVHFWLGESQRRMDHLSELTVEKKHGCIQPLLWVEKHSQFVS